MDDASLNRIERARALRGLARRARCMGRPSSAWLEDEVSGVDRLAAIERDVEIEVVGPADVHVAGHAGVDGDNTEAGEPPGAEVDLVQPVVPVGELVPAAVEADHQGIGPGVAEDLVTVAFSGVDDVVT